MGKLAGETRKEKELEGRGWDMGNRIQFPPSPISPRFLLIDPPPPFFFPPISPFAGE